MKARFTENLTIAPADIVLDDQPLDQDAVEAIAATLRCGGEIINPISVRRLNRGFAIVAGRHRVAASIKVGRNSIPARVVVGDDASIELVELDENLARRKLTKSDEAELIGRHDALLLQKGVASKAVRDKMQAKGLGKSSRTVRRVRTLATKLGADTVKALNGTSLGFRTELEALCALPEETRQNLIERALSGEQVRATDAVAAAVLPQRNQPSAKVAVLLAAWHALDDDEKAEAARCIASEVGLKLARAKTPDDYSEPYEPLTAEELAEAQRLSADPATVARMRDLILN